jgi:hypothetical protein
MPKKKHPPRRHGRSSRSRTGGGSRRARTDPEATPDLVFQVRRALYDEHPLALLRYVSTLLATLDPRRRNPFDSAEAEDREHVTREELIESFIQTTLPETSGLLAVIVEMDGDELTRARIRKELAARYHALPAWLTNLREVVVYRAVEMAHVFGDGDDVLIGARIDGHEFTCLIYIDHNLGTLVKDAFVVPESIDRVVAVSQTAADDPDTSWHELGLADARARVADAIDMGARTLPPLETDSWPACRPMVEWLITRLPEGGIGYERPAWDDAMGKALADRFFASTYADGLDNDDHRGLLESLVWFGTGYGPGDPLRWSPVNIELLLCDWIPRRIVADVPYLAKAPELLRAFIRFCHAERGIRASLTAETLGAVDHWEPEYQRLIRTPRLQGPAALLAAVGALDPDQIGAFHDEHDLPIEQLMLDRLCRAVGDAEPLQQLDDKPLPDEAFPIEVVPDDIRGRVSEVVDLVDRCCDDMFDVECRTACRRFLARVIARDPNVFRRSGRANTAAAAVVWCVGKANDLMPGYWGGVMVKDVMSFFGLQQGGVSGRATTLLRAGGFEDDHFGDVTLGSPDFLVSTRRQAIIELRDRYGEALGER